jgi:hypothetical protein
MINLTGNSPLTYSDDVLLSDAAKTICLKVLYFLLIVENYNTIPSCAKSILIMPKIEVTTHGVLMLLGFNAAVDP